MTLYAGDSIPPAADLALSDVVADLDLALVLGALTLFGPHRDRYVLVHHVVPSMGLLTLQTRVAEACGAAPDSYFGAGRWTPHVTLARRVRGAELPDLLRVLGACAAVDHPFRVTRCRRWDSVERRTWLL